MTVEEILTSLKDNHFAPFYFLQGEEPYFIDLVSDYIEQHALSESERGFNQIILYGKDTGITEILTNARRFPMMSERQVVMVKEAQSMQDFKNKEARSLLEDYVKNPVPSTILVFCHKYQKLDGKTGLAKSIAGHGVLLTTAKLKEHQVTPWIEKHCKEHKHPVSPEAVQLLADHIGNNLQRLTNEIDKVLINVEDDQLIDQSLVEKHVGISKEYNVFELQRAVMVRDFFKANKIVNYFGSNIRDHHPIPIIALLYSLFSKLALLHQSPDKSQKSLASRLKIPPFFVNEYVNGAKNYPLGKVIENIGYLQIADLEVKGIESPSIHGKDILRQLIFKLLH